MEPYRIKSVEMIKMTTREEREKLLEQAGYNLFQIKSDHVYIDLLTDSGTSALSSKQWSAVMLGDESYAGAKSFYKFEEAVKNITRHKHILPTHQGRGAEKIVFSILGGEGKVFAANTFFDTTRGNIEFSGAEAVDLLDSTTLTSKEKNPFKGNMDVSKLESFIQERGAENIPMVVLTITNNAAGGQPVSMDNIRRVSRICKQAGIMFFFDACRFAENAYFIKTREAGFRDKSVLEICIEMFSYVDGSTMSAKKDGLSNSGGWISLNSDQLAEKCKNLLIMTEGFLTYGGLAGRELECIAQGLKEVVDERYLEHRIKCVERLGEQLKCLGVPIVEPTGGHALYIDAKRFAPHIPPHQFPGQAIVCQLYLEGGIRSCEIGSVMFGKEDDDGKRTTHTVELVRLALPRRVYTSSHLDYTVTILARIYENRYNLKGMEMTYQPPLLRHFTATFRVISDSISGSEDKIHNISIDSMQNLLKEPEKDENKKNPSRLQVLSEVNKVLTEKDSL